MRVVKKTICFPPSYKAKLKQGAERLQISESELIRRAIDDYLAKLGLSVIPSSNSQFQAENSQVEV